MAESFYEIDGKLSVEELLKKYPYFASFKDERIFITMKEYNELKKFENLEIENLQINTEIIRRILSDEEYYARAKKFFEGEIKLFDVCFIVGGDTGGGFRYNNKVAIIKSMEQLIKEGKLQLEENEYERYSKLKELSSFEKLLNKGETYISAIEDEVYEIPERQLLEIMSLPDEEFKQVCSSKKIDGIPTKKFIYAAYNCIKDNGYQTKYVLPDEIIKRLDYKYLVNQIDIESINRLTKIGDELYKELDINKELEKEILDGMNDDFSTLEKAIFIYIKMCKLLSYDEEYYAVDQKGEATNKHRKIAYASTISPENNRVVCYEFNLIYAKLLSKLGINFESEYGNGRFMDEVYGGGHANLKFRDDKFIVLADSVTSIVQGDMARAKINSNLVGLTCVNKNEETKEEFEEIKNNVYRYIISLIKEKQESVQSYDELISEYEKLTKNKKPVSITDRLSVMLEKIKNTKTEGIDLLSYVLLLKKILFTKGELEKDINISIIRNNNPKETDKVAMPVAIISIKVDDKTIYYNLPLDKKIEELSKEELQAKFDNKEFEYLEVEHNIPGIERGELAI